MDVTPGPRTRSSRGNGPRPVKHPWRCLRLIPPLAHQPTTKPFCELPCRKRLMTYSPRFPNNPIPSLQPAFHLLPTRWAHDHLTHHLLNQPPAHLTNPLTNHLSPSVYCSRPALPHHSHPVVSLQSQQGLVCWPRDGQNHTIIFL